MNKKISPKFADVSSSSGDDEEGGQESEQMNEYETSEMDEDSYFYLQRQMIKRGKEPPILKKNKLNNDKRQSFINFIRTKSYQ